jgi:SOS-response transcriptional repressor LexA
LVGCTPQTIQYLLNHDKNVQKSSYSRQIAKVLECNLDWLAANDGPAPKMKTQAEHKSGASDPAIKTPNSPVIKEDFTSASHRIGGVSAIFDTSALPRDVPILSYEKASHMSTTVDPKSLGEPLGWATINKPFSSATFSIPIEDASMRPKFEEGLDFPIIDPARQPSPGKFALARTKSGGAVFRKYRELGPSQSGSMIFEMVPLNSDYATLNSDRDGLEIIGAMVAYTHYEDET